MFRWLLPCLAVLWFPAVVAAAEGGEATFPEGVFAVVENDQQILWLEYLAVYREQLKSRFYHGSVPEGERESFRQEVADQLVDERLLAAEARRQGVEPDSAWVEENLAMVDRQNGSNPDWAGARAEWLPKIRAQLERKSLVQRLEEKVRRLPEPDREAVRAYYRRHPEKFTQPVQNRVSLIMIKVDPSAGGEAWKAAESQMADVRSQLEQGAAFADLAEAYSQDPSAENGGDMGYLHQGMLGGDAQEVIDKMTVGAVSDPVPLLDGVALFKLTGRIDPKLQPFEVVEGRARGLYLREQKELAWQSLVFRLRNGADIRINRALLDSLTD